MTREYALKELYFAINDLAESYESYYYSDSLENLINDIYDDFESRTCENCMYWQGNIETSSKGICTQLGVHNIGGCGDYFERKKEC